MQDQFQLGWQEYQCLSVLRQCQAVPLGLHQLPRHRRLQLLRLLL